MPLRGSPRTHRRIVIAHHLILHGYAHWPPNDPRGSGSREVRKPELHELDPPHFGRKQIQPSREELKAFKRAAEQRLEFPVLWFDDATRQALGQAIANIVAQRQYTVWACAVLQNHIHLCVRRHRDTGREMWNAFADGTRRSLGTSGLTPADHPVWSSRPYTVFLYTSEDVRRVVQYIEQNPQKEHLSPQQWPFVVSYDGWPRAGQTRRAKG